MNTETLRAKKRLLRIASNRRICGNTELNTRIQFLVRNERESHHSSPISLESDQRETSNLPYVQEIDDTDQHT